MALSTKVSLSLLSHYIPPLLCGGNTGVSVPWDEKTQQCLQDAGPELEKEDALTGRGAPQPRKTGLLQRAGVEEENGCLLQRAGVEGESGASQGQVN